MQLEEDLAAAGETDSPPTMATGEQRVRDVAAFIAQTGGE